MDDYRSRQRERWSTASGSVVPTMSSVSAPATLPTPVQPVVVDSRNIFVDKVHILPIHETVSDADRVNAASDFLHVCMRDSKLVEAGHCFESSGGTKYAVVSTSPGSGGKVNKETDFFVEGLPVPVLTKLQLVALVGGDALVDEDSIFQSVLNPYLERRLSEEFGIALWHNQVIKIGNTRFIVSAMEGPSGDVSPSRGHHSIPTLGILTAETTLYVDIDTCDEFARVHVLPFQDTLPRVYDFDIFNDYLNPYFSANPLSRYSANTQFIYHGVQFKVVCVDPSDGRPRRIGPDTVIHCEGLLHSSLRTMLPPELLEQLSTLPPGLQMLLLNTELMASADVLDRFIDLQETLAARRGLTDDMLDRIPTEIFARKIEESANQSENSMHCMICLSDFEQGETLRRLPCAHLYHKACIDEWLHRCTDCPLCKTNVENALNGWVENSRRRGNSS